MARGYYYYNTSVATWVRIADNLNDYVWKAGGIFRIQLRDTTDGAEIMDGYTGASTNYSLKLKILKKTEKQGNPS